MAIVCCSTCTVTWLACAAQLANYLSIDTYYNVYVYNNYACSYVYWACRVFSSVCMCVCVCSNCGLSVQILYMTLCDSGLSTQRPNVLMVCFVSVQSEVITFWLTVCLLFWWEWVDSRACYLRGSYGIYIIELLQQQKKLYHSVPSEFVNGQRACV